MDVMQLMLGTNHRTSSGQQLAVWDGTNIRQYEFDGIVANVPGAGSAKLKGRPNWNQCLRGCLLHALLLQTIEIPSAKAKTAATALVGMLCGNTATLDVLILLDLVKSPVSLRQLGTREKTTDIAQ
jgi:hypothetical protein